MIRTIARTFIRVFRRYSTRHLVLSSDGPALIGPGAEFLGQVEKISLSRGQLTVSGHAEVPGLRLEGGGSSTIVHLDTAGGASGFQLSIPIANAQLVLLRHEREEQVVPIPPFSRMKWRWAQVGLLPRFVLTLMWLSPDILAWSLRRDMAAHGRIKRGLKLTDSSDQKSRLFAREAICSEGPAHIGWNGAAPAIIMPIHNAADKTAEALRRLAAHTHLPGCEVRVMLVEDGSTQSGLRDMVRAWIETAPATLPVTLIEHPTARGFIGAVNHAFEYLVADGFSGPVVLLNSDAFVPREWLPRLLAPLSDQTVASVTPMSNAAEIASAPLLCRDIELGAGVADQIDQIAATLSREPVTAPTGVGFCMAMGAVWWQRNPRFDSAFGAGYGEEVDWCQRAAKRGGKSVIVPNLYIEHCSGSSFGASRKADLLIKNSELINARYPDYDMLVQEFIAADPLASQRFALALAWASAAARPSDLPVYVAHSLGGGAERWLQDRIEADCAEFGSAVVLRVGGPVRFEASLHTVDGVARIGVSAAEDLLSLFRCIPSYRLVYSCAVGDPEPIRIPTLLVALAADQKLDVLIHDYFPIDADYTLSGAPGETGAIFRSLPSEPDSVVAFGPKGEPQTRSMWRNAWLSLLERADRIICFSDASAELLKAAYPGVATSVFVRPHRLLHTVALVRPARRRGPPVIAALGNIAPHKGAGVLEALSLHLRHHPRQGRLVLLGALDPSYELAPPARIHGAYHPGEIASLAARYGVDCWLVPSTWPETFSYTTHEALATGLPVLGFDLGAQGEALRRSADAGAAAAALPLDLAHDPAAIAAHAAQLAQKFEFPSSGEFAATASQRIAS